MIVESIMSRQGTLLRGCPSFPHLPPRSRILSNTFPLRQQEEVERDGEPVSNPTPATRSVVNVPGTITEAWGLIIRRILVRAEYEEAERTALEANELETEAFLVGGLYHGGSFDVDLFGGYVTPPHRYAVLPDATRTG